jgi:site-specific recombinase XerD
MNEELISAWLDWLEAGNVSPATLRLRHILIWTFARHHDLATATPADVQRHLATRPGGAASKASHLSTLRSFYRFSLRAGLVDHDPTLLVHPIRVHCAQQEPIPATVLASALGRVDARTRFMLLLGSKEGLRRSEIAELCSAEISETHLTILGKGGKVRRVPIHRDVRACLAAVDGWAFPSCRRPGDHIGPDEVAHVVRMATGWTTHSLRRRFAQDAYDGTLDLRAVQELLGHADSATTSRYVRSSQSNLEAAVLAVA